MPMADFDDWQREVERYLSHFVRQAKRPSVLFTQHSHTAPVWTPAVDMYETEDALVVLLDLAGVEPDRTEVQAEPGRLVVRGLRHERHRPAGPAEHRTYHALEIAYGRFERTLPLPPGLDTAAARAAYRDGLLEITLPRRAPHQVKVVVEHGEGQTAEETA